MSTSDDTSEASQILSHLRRMGAFKERWPQEALLDFDLWRLEKGLKEEKDEVIELLRIVLGELKKEERKGLRGKLLRAAAEDGYGKSTEAFLDAGVSPDLAGERGETALHCAAREGTNRIVDLLLGAGARLNAKAGTHERTPLHRAASSGCEGVVRRLVDDGAEVDGTDRRGDTPLFLAAREGEAEAADALIDAGADTEVINDRGRRPLHEAVRNGNADVAARLVDAGANPDVNDRRGRTPLHLTATEDAGDIAEMLLRAGADPRATDDQGETPLERAQAFGTDRVARVLEQTT